MVRIRFRHLLPILAALTLWLPAQAQLHRGARTIVRGGMLVQRDSLASKTDSLADLSLVRELDSLMTGLFAADSAAVAELRTDDISKADSLYRLKMAGIKIESDTTKHKRGWLMSDSMSLSKVCWISTVLPGYGQIYNKQYWKLPVLYGTWARVWPSISTKTRLTSPSSATTKPTRTKTSRARPNWTRCKAG